MRLSAPKVNTAQQDFNATMRERLEQWYNMTPRPLAGNPMDNSRLNYVLQSSVVKEHLLGRYIKNELAPDRNRELGFEGLFDTQEMYLSLIHI